MGSSTSLAALAGTGAQMLEQGKRRVPVNGVELSIEVAGAGAGPPLLFVTPGWGVNIAAYRGLRPLEQRFTVIWCETRGTGESTAPEDHDYRLSTFTSDAEALRDALGIEGWWLAGHSFGGALVQDYIAHHPDRSLGSILLCTLPAGDPANFEEIIARGTARAGEPGCDDALAAMSTVPTTDDEALQLLADIMPLYFRDLDACHRFLAETDGVSCRVDAMVAESPQCIDRRVADGLLSTIDVPSVVLAASDDFVCSPPRGQIVHHTLRGSKFVLVEEAGHFPWFEQPERFWSGLHRAIDSLAVWNLDDPSSPTSSRPRSGSSGRDAV